ncbi:MAG: 3-deoxy-D-manno-octulosonic acid transferase [Turneriella sp.]|nr:3-deoxy-D-manno-octulosonic acid transferase [Turneriella sp.]
MLFYNLFLCILYPLLRFASLFHKRLRENFTLRSKTPHFTAARGKVHIWFHAASAGEFEQVRAVAIFMKQMYPKISFFFSFSFFSDSAYRAKKNDTVPNILFALPFDFSWRMKRLVAQMQPDALIIGKYDAWANQVLAACNAGVPVYMASATLPQASLRYKWPLRKFFHRIYSPMRQIFAINSEHAERFRKISRLNVSVVGDTRFDAIQIRLGESRNTAKEVAAIKKIFSKKKILVCGSTYPTSEKMLAGYLKQKPVIEKKQVGLIIAPHHVNETRVKFIEELCEKFLLHAIRLSRIPPSALPKNLDVLIVDRLGLLPHLYPLADVAYVGGGFEGSVHSVIEATLAKAAVVTGPAILNSAEAMELAREGLLVAMEIPSYALFSEIVENLCKTTLVNAKKTAIFARERLGVTKKIVHTVVDDISIDSKLAKAKTKE